MQYRFTLDITGGQPLAVALRGQSAGLAKDEVFQYDDDTYVVANTGQVLAVVYALTLKEVPARYLELFRSVAFTLLVDRQVKRFAVGTYSGKTGNSVMVVGYDNQSDKFIIDVAAPTLTTAYLLYQEALDGNDKAYSFVPG